MRLAIVSDIHANLAALQTVLADIDARGADAILCLGDVVGYGPDPERCVEIVRERCAATVLGNHEAAVAQGAGLEVLPRDGQAAALRHREWLGADDLDWLAALPLLADVHGVTLAHAGPAEPESWPRIDTYHAVQAQFEAFSTGVCFVGHSHRPALAAKTLGVTRVKPGHRYLINVGSVGQPRDGDVRAAYGVFDTEAVSYELVRLHYDVAHTQARVAERGLPAELGDRLARGL